MNAVTRNTLDLKDHVICDGGCMPQELDDMFAMTHWAIRKRARPNIISRWALHLEGGSLVLLAEPVTHARSGDGVAPFLHETSRCRLTYVNFLDLHTSTIYNHCRRSAWNHK